MRNVLCVLALVLSSFVFSFAQVDTSYVYNPNAPYGSLDIRIAKSATRYYYLKEDVTFSFRESSPGVKTNTFFDMTSWDSSPYGQGHMRERNGESDIFIMNYRLLKPEGYNPTYAKGYPLIIMFHGSGEKANCWNDKCYHATTSYNPVDNNPPAPTDPNSELLNNDHNLLHGGRIYLDAVRKAGTKLPDDPTLPTKAFPGFVLFPQNLNGWSVNSVQDALKLLRLIVKKYNIDEDRIYINGLSNGGHGVYQALKRAPWMFAASITMSAVDDASITSANLQSTVANIPMWVFQGKLDNKPYPSKTKRWVKLMRDAGAVIRYTEYEDLAHTTWNRAYAEPDFFTWMLGVNKSAVHVFAGNPAICSAGGTVPLRLPAGFKAYQWELNGQIISGANTDTYMASTAGKYRGRFSRDSATPTEAQWNEWSPAINITIQQQPVAEIKQIGTVVLKDLNGGNTVTLESTKDFAHYYWYKNGVLLDLPGTQDDTLKSITLSAGTCNGTCSGNGAYTLVTSNYDNCNSAPSAAKHVFFNDTAPINLSAPGNFTGEKKTTSSIDLKWQDVTTNEIGFEIWRKVKVTSGTSNWEMATLTAANATSFTDTGLQPSTTYQYKIRAVSSSGRSDYTPTAATVVEVATGVDETAPSAPANLQAMRIALDAARLTWKKATDDSGIRQYEVTFNGQTVLTPQADTTLVLSNLVIDSTYNISVKAVDLSGNKSAASNSVTMLTNVSGLFYQYLTGYWPSLDSINWSIPEKTGFIENFLLTPRTQEDYFALRFDGYLYINTEGSYTFRTSSDDASRLRMNGTLIVDNNGIHNLKTVESTAVTLAKGANRISVDYFEYIQDDTLIVEYKGADTNNQWARISNEALRSNIVISTDPTLSNALLVEVYPNPAGANDVNVRIESLRPTPIKLTLVDAVGRDIFDDAFDPGEVRSGVRLPLAQSLTNGLYILRVVQDEQVVQRKIIIENK
jgi:hypothetical protein